MIVFLKLSCTLESLGEILKDTDAGVPCVTNFIIVSGHENLYEYIFESRYFYIEENREILLYYSDMQLERFGVRILPFYCFSVIIYIDMSRRKWRVGNSIQVDDG